MRERIDVSAQRASTTFVSLGGAQYQCPVGRSNEAFPLLHPIPFVFAVACGVSSAGIFDDSMRPGVEKHFGIDRACDADGHSEAGMYCCPCAAHLSNSPAMA